MIQVGNRRDKVAKASKALWDLMDGDENSDDERESVSCLASTCNDMIRRNKKWKVLRGRRIERLAGAKTFPKKKLGLGTPPKKTVGRCLCVFFEH